MKHLPVIIDDRPAECGTMPEGLYVYQTIRTVGHRGIDIDRHIEILDAAAAELLDRRVGVAPSVVGERIARLLADSGYPTDMPASATVRKYRSGEVAILGGEILPYRRLSMRTVSPRGVVVGYELPFAAVPSSLTLAATEAARVAAIRRLRAAVANGDLPSGADEGRPVVLRRNWNGDILSADDAPLFVLADDVLVTPPQTFPSAEFEVACRAIARAGIPLATGRIDEEMLAHADEAFFIDHRGLTALSTVDLQPYMHIIAERIGKHLA